MLALILPRVYCGKRKTLSLGLTATKQNQKIAELIARQIEVDFATGHLDSSLNTYQLTKGTKSAPKMSRHAKLVEVKCN